MDGTSGGSGRVPDLQSVIERVKTESALNPLLWLAGLTLIAAVAAACFGAEITWALLYLACACVVVALGAYLYFMIFDPNRLHSERFQLERHKMDLMLDERFSNSRDALTIDATPTANVAAPAQLGGGR